MKAERRIKFFFYSSEGMNTCNGIDGGFAPTDCWLLVRERRTAARARSAQSAAQFAAGHAAARLDTRGAARKLRITNYLTIFRVEKITTLKTVKQLSLSDLQVALYATL